MLKACLADSSMLQHVDWPLHLWKDFVGTVLEHHDTHSDPCHSWPPLAFVDHEFQKRLPDVIKAAIPHSLQRQGFRL